MFLCRGFGLADNTVDAYINSCVYSCSDNGFLKIV